MRLTVLRNRRKILHYDPTSFLFHWLECIFQPMEHTFRLTEYAFHPLERKIYRHKLQNYLKQKKAIPTVSLRIAFFIMFCFISNPSPAYESYPNYKRTDVVSCAPAPYQNYLSHAQLLVYWLLWHQLGTCARSFVRRNHPYRYVP